MVWLTHSTPNLDCVESFLGTLWALSVQNAEESCWPIPYNYELSSIPSSCIAFTNIEKIINYGKAAGREYHEWPTKCVLGEWQKQTVGHERFSFFHLISLNLPPNHREYRQRCHFQKWPNVRCIATTLSGQRSFSLEGKKQSSLHQMIENGGLGYGFLPLTRRKSYFTTVQCWRNDDI